MSSPDPVPGLKDHVPGPDCWCHPTEIEPGLWLHHLTADLDPHVEGYVPDLKGAIEGDDAL